MPVVVDENIRDIWCNILQDRLHTINGIADQTIEYVNFQYFQSN